MEFFTLVIVSLFVGLGVGILSGLLGLGGGTLFVPILRLGYGLSAIACTATSLMIIMLTSISGSVTHIRKRTCLPLLGVITGVAGAATSPVGVYLATYAPEWLIIVVTALIMIYSAGTMISKAIKAHRAKRAQLSASDGLDKTSAEGPFREDIIAGQTGTDNTTAEQAVTDNAAAEQAVTGNTIARHAVTDNAAAEIVVAQKLPARKLVIGLFVGIVAGICAGFAGVGGGFIMVPMFIQLVGLSMRLTSGTSMLAICITSITGVIYQAYLGNVVWMAGIAIAIGSIPGAILGAALVTRVPEQILRLIFGIFLGVAALILVINQFVFA